MAFVAIVGGIVLFGVAATALLAVGQWLAGALTVLVGAVAVAVGGIYLLQRTQRRRERGPLPHRSLPSAHSLMRWVVPPGARGEFEALAGPLGPPLSAYYVRRPYLTGVLLVPAAVVVPTTVLIAVWQPWLGPIPVVLLVGGRAAYNALVMPAGGRRVYLVFQDGLGVITDGGATRIRWSDVLELRHRAYHGEQQGNLLVHYRDICWLTVAGRQEPLAVHGAARQDELSRLIARLCREHLVHRHLSTFETEGRLRLGELDVALSGVGDASGRHLPWCTGWKFNPGTSPDSVTLEIRKDRHQRVRGAVPETSVAIELLTQLAHQYTSADRHGDDVPAS